MAMKARCDAVRCVTLTKTFDGVARVGDKVRVAKHVLVVNDEANQSQIWSNDFEHQLAIVVRV